MGKNQADHRKTGSKFDVAKGKAEICLHRLTSQSLACSRFPKNRYFFSAEPLDSGNKRPFLASSSVRDHESQIFHPPLLRAHQLHTNSREWDFYFTAN
jgi:hypothetical protein